MTIHRENLGILVRGVWIEWAKQQPDIAEHPHWLTPWADLSERDKEVDRKIGDTVARYVLAHARNAVIDLVKPLIAEQQEAKHE